MLAACCAIALLTLALTLVWILRGFLIAPTAKLADIDVRAFRNVLSLEDDRVLRGRLPQAQYRELKRARVRAVQEYVRAIAANCAVTIAVLRAKTADRNSILRSEISALVSDALRIRLLCLGFWIVLWAEFIFPNLEIRPMQIAGGYERLHSAAERCLRSPQMSSPAL
jgi:hypothetical protein